MTPTTDETVCVIPARYGSTRFPGKPLAEVRGRSMIRRMVDTATASRGIDRILVATDDDRIAAHVDAFGGTAVMTDPECRNGTERVAHAIETLGLHSSRVINLQGDAVLTPPWVLEAVVDAMVEDPSAGIVTPAARLDASSRALLLEAKDNGEVGGTTVVVDREGYALYFSKAPIPFVRDVEGGAPTLRHIGLYGYTREALFRFVNLDATPLERTEGLEQLRALEHGMRVRVVEVDFRGRRHLAIDSPEDLVRVERLLDEDGELIEERNR